MTPDGSGAGVSWRDYTDAQIAAIKEAQRKSESELRDRLAGMNQIREQLREQAAQFATRENVELARAQLHKDIESLQARIADVEKCQANSAGRSWMLFTLLGLGLTVLSLALRWLIP